MKRWWRLRKPDADVERELQSDLDLEEEEQRERGLPPQEARYAALRAFGNPSLISEQTRAVWSWNALENLLRDVRIGWRQLCRNKVTSVAAVLSLALGIGSCVAAFRLIDALFWRPLPIANATSLYVLSRQMIGLYGRPSE